ncbi:hypothetical protein LIER_08954 [Lithospermum erythrorhizon]|uniref:Integrase catalytic domain-containing protein n=1 Tax=Lithospermum erythrorhizon TaxID=34254 RepID=A0AAV3PE02_LITER
MYYPQANGLAEAFNKNLCNLMKKTVKKSQKDWPSKMEEVFWVYRTTFRTATQTTPYAFVYGIRTVLPLEEVYPSGAYLMTSSEWNQVGPINGRYLKRYYPPK